MQCTSKVEFSVNGSEQYGLESSQAMFLSFSIGLYRTVMEWDWLIKTFIYHKW